MSVSSQDSVFGLGTTQVIVPVGATVAVFIAGIAGQNSTLLKYYTGGTLEVIGVANAGATLTAAQLATASGNHYLFGTSEVLSIDGPASFYLSSTGATTTMMVIRGKTQGTS